LVGSSVGGAEACEAACEQGRIAFSCFCLYYVVSMRRDDAESSHALIQIKR